MLAVAVVFAVGSAFTTAKADAPKENNGAFADYTFVHVAHTTTNNRTDYIYRASPSNCGTSTTNICKSVWSQSSTPADGANPAADAVQGTIQNGNYLGS